MNRTGSKAKNLAASLSISSLKNIFSHMYRYQLICSYQFSTQVRQTYLWLYISLFWYLISKIKHHNIKNSFLNDVALKILQSNWRFVKILTNHRTHCFSACMWLSQRHRDRRSSTPACLGWTNKAIKSTGLTRAVFAGQKCIVPARWFQRTNQGRIPLHLDSLSPHSPQF